MLRLKTLLAEAGITQGGAAAAIGLSRPALSQIVNNDVWPKTTARAVIEAWIGEFLTRSGIDAAGAFEVKADRSSDQPPIYQAEQLDKGVDMLLDKRRLTAHAKAHFGLKHDPFDREIEDEDDVFLTPAMRERVEDMTAALLNKRLIAVIGESGSGKTTLREYLEEQLKPKVQGGELCLIKPHVSGVEADAGAGRPLRVGHIEEAIIRTLAPHLRIPQSGERRAELVANVIRRASHASALVIEEAHCLPLPTLKHFKRLREESKDGLKMKLGVLLIGQTELDARLSTTDPKIRELAQRCEKVFIEPLNQHIGAFVAHRFARAGAAAEKVFAPDAYFAIGNKLMTKETQRVRQGGKSTTLEIQRNDCYPLAVGNWAAHAMNQAAELGEEKVTAELLGGLSA